MGGATTGGPMAAIASIAGEQLKAALGSAGKKSKGNDRGIFAHDDMMTALLMIAPASIITILVFFSNSYFHADLITCSLRETPTYREQTTTARSYRYDYSFFDYSFLQNYCYANLKDYKINENNGSLTYKDGTYEDYKNPKGDSSEYQKHPLIYLKLYPYILVLFFLSAILIRLLWSNYNGKVSAMLALTLDGVEEGASLLFEGLLEIYEAGEKQDIQRGQHVKDTDSLKSAANENAGYVNEVVPGNTSPLHGAEENRMRAAKELQFIATKNYFWRGQSKTRVQPFETSKSQDFESSRDTAREISKELKENLEKIWARKSAHSRFQELEKLMANLAQRNSYIVRIYLIRSLSIIFNFGCLAATAYYFVYDLYFVAGSYFNCYLPETYWYEHQSYETNDTYLWKTTRCYIKATYFWLFSSSLLLLIYIFCLITQINGLTANISQMKKSSKLVKYLPINNSIMPPHISDLHVIMALAHENNRSREKLHAMDKGNSFTN